MSSVLVASSISTATNNTIELSYSDNGINWGTSPIAQQSDTAVGLAVFNGLLWAAFRANTSTSLFVGPSSNWGSHNDTGQSTHLAPSITVFNNHLWVAYIGADTGHVEVISSGNGSNWSSVTATGQSSNNAPSIAVFDNQLWIAYIGKDTNGVEVISSKDGSSWSKVTDTGQSSDHAPSLAVFSDKLWIAYIGKNSGNVEVISSSNGTTGWSASTGTGQSSNLAPSMAVLESKLWIAYIGSASGNVETISSGNGTGWSARNFTGQLSAVAPAILGASSVQPPSGLGGSTQYILASPQGDGWPASNVNLPPIKQLLLWIQILEELQFDPAVPPSFQLNCCAPANGSWKIGFQQYVLMMQPNSTELFLHIQNFGRDGQRAVYAGNSSTINFPNSGSIPAGWAFQLALQFSGDNVTGASCVVVDANHATVGVLQLHSVGLPLALQSGNVDDTWLAPIVVFQMNVVGYAEAARTRFTSGNGYILYECSTPLVAGTGEAGSNCPGEGTTESSNCVYSVLPDFQNGAIVQCFGAPPGV